MNPPDIPLATFLLVCYNQQAIAPSFTNLVRWQTHHYVCLLYTSRCV